MLLALFPAEPVCKKRRHRMGQPLIPAPLRHTCGRDRTIQLTEGLAVIDVSSELTEAMRESHRASTRLFAAMKAGNPEAHRAAMKECLAAWHQKRAAWLAMATPVPASDELKSCSDTPFA